MALKLVAAATAAAATLALAGPAVAAPVSVGTGRPGQTALEFVGKVDQQGADFTYYGYLSYVRGLGDAELFTAPGIDQSASTARFTFLARTRMVRRTVIENVFAIASTGSFTIYLNPGGASFDEPSSFAAGRAVATSGVRFQNVITVLPSAAGPAPGSGAGPGPGQADGLPSAISTGTGGAEQRSSSVFTLGGREYRMGRRGFDLRLLLSGFGVLLEPTAPRAVLFLAGNAAVAK